MSNQQKDNPSPGSTGGQGLRQKASDDTGGTQGDALSGAVGAAAGGGPGKGTAAPPADKGGAAKA